MRICTGGSESLRPRPQQHGDRVESGAQGWRWHLLVSRARAPYFLLGCIHTCSGLLLLPVPHPRLSWCLLAQCWVWESGGCEVRAASPLLQGPRLHVHCPPASQGVFQRAGSSDLHSTASFLPGPLEGAAGAVRASPWLPLSRESKVITPTSPHCPCACFSASLPISTSSDPQASPRMSPQSPHFYILCLPFPKL